MTGEPDFLKKNVGARTWAKWPRIGPETRFFSIFTSLVH